MHRAAGVAPSVSNLSINAKFRCVFQVASELGDAYQNGMYEVYRVASDSTFIMCAMALGISGAVSIKTHRIKEKRLQHPSYCLPRTHTQVKNIVYSKLFARQASMPRELAHRRWVRPAS